MRTVDLRTQSVMRSDTKDTFQPKLLLEPPMSTGFHYHSVKARTRSLISRWTPTKPSCKIQGGKASNGSLSCHKSPWQWWPYHIVLWALEATTRPRLQAHFLSHTPRLWPSAVHLLKLSCLICQTGLKIPPYSNSKDLKKGFLYRALLGAYHRISSLNCGCHRENHSSQMQDHSHGGAAYFLSFRRALKKTQNQKSPKNTIL